MSFLMLAADFTFGRHLSNWTIHDLKRPNLKRKSMKHAKLLTFCSNTLTWFFQIKKDVRKLELALVCWTLARRLSVNNILR